MTSSETVRRVPARWILVAAACVAATGPSARLRAGQYELKLDGAMPNDTAMTLYLDMSEGQVEAAFGAGRKFNKAPYNVGASGLTLEGRKLSGPVDVTIAPDAWTPKDGEEIPCAFTLDGRIAGGRATGTYKGTRGGQKVSGPMTGKRIRPAPADGARYRIWMFQALRRLSDGGSNVNYALDMDLGFTMRGGEPIRPRFETIVPDYRRYCALVRRIDVALEGSRFAATAVVDVDHGNQGRKGARYKRRERYTYALKGLAMGDAVAGRYTATVGDRRDEGIIFFGSIDRRPPPQPEGSLAFLRLHDAMRDAYPVVLYLSLGQQWRIHGYGYAPGYNHQPQTVDASGLKLRANRLTGKVAVTVVPDCYHDQDVTFEMHYRIDATVSGRVVEGDFSGRDRGRKSEGVITGELRRQAPPAVTNETLRAAELHLGYCMPEGRRGDTHAVVRLRWADGEVRSARVVRPEGGKPYDAEVTRARLNVQGDRLTGAVAFTLDSPKETAGKYRFELEAIIDGEKLRGFWRGTRNGEPILTKSSKLGGRLIAGESPPAAAP